MEIVIPPPVWILIIAIAIPLVAIVSIFLKKGPAWAKILGVAISVGAGIVLMLLLYRPVSLTVSAEGIDDKSYGGEVVIAWGEIDEIRLVHGYRATDYDPVLRTNGAALGVYNAGWYNLADGQNVRAFFQESPDALIIRRGEGTFLYAPNDFDAFLEQVRLQYPGEIIVE